MQETAAVAGKSGGSSAPVVLSWLPAAAGCASQMLTKGFASLVDVLGNTFVVAVVVVAAIDLSLGFVMLNSIAVLCHDAACLASSNRQLCKKFFLGRPWSVRLD